MKRAFSISMTILFPSSLSLLITLGIVVIVLGPSRTEQAIRSLFKHENYTQHYKKLLPFLAKVPSYQPTETPGEILGVSRDIRNKSELPPLIVPTCGIAPRAAFLYTGKLSDGKHEGIDIWTSIDGKGSNGTTFYKGNPVYAACSGVVTKRWDANGDLWILCDELDFVYEGVIPSRNVLTLYGHMADQQTPDTFIYVREGDRVQQGQLIGHQGNRCYYSPQNLVVHLHFGVYDATRSFYVPLDPTPYIGVSCTTLNQIFETEI